ncbi:MAG TPA: hypothetical protein VK582_04550 [Pyrinomonadaceae bacterium]|nr:hypothetical protein [Pyrinomonadaceae bacterium]
MFEDFFTDWDDQLGGVPSQSWEGNLKYVEKLKGKNVLVVDFASCDQLNETNGIGVQQQAKVKEHAPNWPNYLADHDFVEVRYNFKCEK